MSEYPEIAARFARETAGHEMTVLHDDGLYRHLRFEAPDSSGYWFTLTTWPQKLVVNGPVGTYVFSRIEDMLDFFRQSAAISGLNPGYWAEKVVASGDDVKCFSLELFEKQVAEYLAEAEDDWPGVTAAWKEKVDSFFPEYDITYEDGARAALNDFEYLPEGAKPGEVSFQFYDTAEWELRDFDWKFLWSCHAVVWGIRQYDAKRAAAQAGGAS